MAMCTHFQAPPKVKGFTLIELLCVLAILSALLALVGLAVKDPGTAHKLRSAGGTIANLGQQARQNSLGQNCLTAVIFSKQASANSPDWQQRVALYEVRPPGNGVLTSSTDWKQVTPWVKLPPGTLVAETESTFFSAPAAPTPPIPSTLTISGQHVNAYAAQVYLPNGRLLNNTTSTVKLIPAVLANGTPMITSLKNGSQSAQFVTVTFIAQTGQIKVDMP